MLVSGMVTHPTNYGRISPGKDAGCPGYGGIGGPVWFSNSFLFQQLKMLKGLTKKVSWVELNVCTKCFCIWKGFESCVSKFVKEQTRGFKACNTNPAPLFSHGSVGSFLWQSWPVLLRGTGLLFHHATLQTSTSHQQRAMRLSVWPFGSLTGASEWTSIHSIKKSLFSS